ncbi:response regulator transcription factor [Serinibacter arcticus]|uniref:Putative two-component system response regulator n=1 Tax=Serinibacter arcticus TaxID=1655435 RepID=A0A4Z1E1H0_9MICO|nr:response regulator transcription factor [Serinibacter arcticus]TGO05795.1 putative two-component system response regulator [Serinibacter arcticus]
MSTPTRSVVIVEDDPDVRRLLEMVLRPAGFDTHSAATGLEGVDLARETDPIVVTLDISLPDIDGFEVARRIRTFSDAYIIMLTARVDEIDALMGLESGADDYITKPFRPRELRARIEAMLRRPRTTERSGAEGAEGTLTTAAATLAPPVGPGGLEPFPQGPVRAQDERGRDLVVDRLARTVTLAEDDVHLTRSEFDILAHLVTVPGRVSSKEDLARMLRHGREDASAPVEQSENRRLDVHMVNLRRKLDDDSSNPRWIETVRGVGYRFRQPQS